MSAAADETPTRPCRGWVKLSGSQSTKKEIGGRVEGKMREAVVAEEEGVEVKGVFTLLMYRRPNF